MTKLDIIGIFLCLAITKVTGETNELNQPKSTKETVFVIMSQPDQYHTKLARECRTRLESSLKSRGLTSVPIVTIGEEIPNHGSWTVFPIIFHLGNRLKLNAKWYIFLDMVSVVNLASLENVLRDHAEDHFIGYALKDESHTIIHHFRDPKELEYPHFGAGFILSGSIVNEVSASMAEHGNRLDWLPMDFSIDAQYEFAKALVDRQKRHVLKHEPRMCLKYDENCAIYPKFDGCDATDEKVLELSQKVLFAVKTCQKYHEERLPIIKKTWAEAAPNIMYFSEVTDKDFETIQLDGVKNTERGHCQKTMAIIKYFHENADVQGWKWLIIADDDTILSVAKMMELLLCFDADPDENIHLGQRYGYRVAFGRYGYDYVTGGGGMVFNRKMVATMIEDTNSRCQCSSADSPDDMHLGICMSNLDLTIVHSPLFHQARPEDYAQDLLLHSRDHTVSFHKFWNTDPLKMYDDWFRKSDHNLRAFKHSNVNIKAHDEL